MRFVVNPTGIERPGRPRSAFTAFVSLAPDGRVLDAALGQ
jgi:hypothetical protein